MKEKNKTVAKPDDRSFSPMNEIPNLPKSRTPWSTSQASAFRNFGSTPTSGLTPSSPRFYSPRFGSQMWNRPVQYGSLHQSSSFSNYPMMAARVGQSSLSASAENNMRFRNHSYKISQPTSNVAPKAKENERRPSIQGTNMKGSTRSVTIESKETTVTCNDNKNNGGSTKVHIHCNKNNNTKEQRKRKAEHTSPKISSIKRINELLDISSTKQQHSRTMPGTGNFEANPSDLNQNLRIKASSAKPRLEEESDDTKEQRKRKVMNKSCKRPKVKMMKDIFSAKQEQSSVTTRNGGGGNNVTSIGNCNSVQHKANIGSNHFEANPTERNRNLSAKLSATNPKLANEESDDAKEQRRKQSEEESAKRSRMKMKMECERLHASIKNLYAKNAALRKELHDRMDECDKMIEDNDSLLDELNEMFGKEKVMEGLNMKSAESDADDDDQNSNDR